MFTEVSLGTKKHFTCWLSYKVGTFIIPSLQRKKLRHNVCDLPEKLRRHQFSKCTQLLGGGAVTGIQAVWWQGYLSGATTLDPCLVGI